MAEKLAWVQNPDAGPFYGYYHRELIEHPLVICNRVSGLTVRRSS